MLHRELFSKIIKQTILKSEVTDFANLTYNSQFFFLSSKNFGQFVSGILPKFLIILICSCLNRSSLTYLTYSRICHLLGILINTELVNPNSSKTRQKREKSSCNIKIENKSFRFARGYF